MCDLGESLRRAWPWERYISLGSQKEIQLRLDGGREGRLLSHPVGRRIRRNLGLPSAELPLDKVPQPWGLGPPCPISGLFPVGPGEDDSVSREGREARPVQDAQAGQAARQEVG